METALFKTTKRLSSSASQSRGEQSEIVGVSSMKSLSQISHREARKWEAIRRFSLSLSLSISFSHSALLSQHQLALTHVSTIPVNMTGTPGASCLQSWTTETDGLFSVLLSSPAVWLRCRQMIAFKLWIQPEHNSERCVCMWNVPASCLRCLFGFVLMFQR